jgi:hypothetical protein
MSIPESLLYLLPRILFVLAGLATDPWREGRATRVVGMALLLGDGAYLVSIWSLRQGVDRLATNHVRVDFVLVGTNDDRSE